MISAEQRLESVRQELWEWARSVKDPILDINSCTGWTADNALLRFNADAAPGQFTKRLISLMKTVMRRSDQTVPVRDDKADALKHAYYCQQMKYDMDAKLYAAMTTNNMGKVLVYDSIS